MPRNCKPSSIKLAPPGQPPEGLQFVPGCNCCTVARAGRVALLVDGEAYFRAFAQAAARATRSILILAWDFSSTTRLHFDGGGGAAPAQLGEFLNRLARRRRDLHIRILDWDYPMLFGTDREFPPIYGLGWKPHHRVQVVYDDTEPVGGSHHQKVVVIDDAVAFVGGLDLTDRRWDTPAHCVDDRRRRCGSSPYPPFHDVMMAVDGEAARALGEIARVRWQLATHCQLPPVEVVGDPWPPALAPDFTDVDVAIARTLPGSAAFPEVREVEALYLDMIAAARHSLYIENQYFTADRIAEALAARLAEPDPPEVVLVLRLLSHGWLEEHTMHVLRTRLLQRLRRADRHGRFQVYYAHIDGLADGTCIDVHSKLMIVDDQVLRVGSANLSNRSLGLDSECDAAIAAGGDPAVAAGIGHFRDRLLGEHLDCPPASVAAAIDRHGGLHAAIAALQGRPRTLKVLDNIPQWPETVLDLAGIADPERPVSLEQLIEEFSPAATVASAPARPLRAAALKLAALLVGCAGLALLWRYTPLAQTLDPGRIVAWARAFGGQPWAPLLVIGAYTPACLLMFPRPLITLAAIVAFGPFLGALYALAGILLAALVTYAAGRRLPRRMVRSLAGKRLNRVSDTLRRRGLLAMTAVRLVPVAPFAVIGLVAGAIHIRLRHFMLGTLFGTLPGTAVTTLFGHQLGDALQGLSPISYGLLAGVVAVVLALSLAVRRWLVGETRRAKGHADPRYRTR